MAYDIGQGISDAFGSVAEGMLTRKERQDEREKLIGQYEAIEEYKHKEFQDLLNQGAGENLVKAAQTEYEKWSKRGDELTDEPTKKIEGILAEYDKGEVRKSRRLQNRMAELQIELAEETNPYTAQQKISEAKKAALGVQLIEDQQKEKTALGEFRALYGSRTTKPVQGSETLYMSKDPFHSWSETQEIADENEVKPSLNYLNPYQKPARLPYPQGNEGIEKAERQIMSERPNPNPYLAGIEDRNAFGLTDELPPSQADPELGPLPEEDFRRYDSPFTRPSTPTEQTKMAQDFLAQYAPRLGSKYKEAEEFKEARNPKATKGTLIEVDGNIVPGKVNVQGNILTIPRGQGLGLGSVPKGFRVKGINQGVDKDGNPTTSVSLERYEKSEQPEFVSTAKMIADGDDEVKFIKDLAGSAGQAKEFNDFYSDSKSSIDTIDEILDLVEHGRQGGGSKRPNWLDLSMPWPLGDRQLQGEIQVRIRTLTGKLRLPLIGPGAVSEYEQKLLKDAIADPTKFFSLTTTNKAKLKTLQTIMDRAVKVKGSSMGLFEYNPKREEGLRPIGSSPDLSSSTFDSIDAANAAGLEEGTEVYINDPVNLGRRKYKIPASDAERTRREMDSPPFAP